MLWALAPNKQFTLLLLFNQKNMAKAINQILFRWLKTTAIELMSTDVENN